MAEDFNLPAEPVPLKEQIKRVVDSRNALIHTGKFRARRSNAMIAEFFFLMEFVDRLILKVLGYSGRYMGWSGTGIVQKSLP